MKGIFEFLTGQPFVLLFLVVAVGYAAGQLKIKNISLGMTAATMITGLGVSVWAQHATGAKFEIPAFVSTVFFNLFMFAVGLRVGPQFFAGLGRDGKHLVLVGLMVGLLVPLLAIPYAKLMHLPPGALGGLLAGANTSSAAFGASQSAIETGAAHIPNGISTHTIEDNLSAAFAITYLIGMVGFVLFIKYLPRMFRRDVQQAAHELEEELKLENPEPLPNTEGALDLDPTGLPVAVRSYRIRSSDSLVVGKTIGALQAKYPKLIIEQVRRGEEVFAPQQDFMVQPGDILGVGARIAEHLKLSRYDREVEDTEVRHVAAETADVVIRNEELVGKRIEEVFADEAHGLYRNAIFRMGETQPNSPTHILKKNDVIRVTGSSRHIETFAKAAGGVVRASLETDIMTVALGLALGALVGSLKIPVGAIKIGFGTAGGLILVGIALGTLRARRPTLGGPFPEPARAVLEDLGLNIFIAILGINAGAGVLSTLNGGALLPLLGGAVLVGFVPPIIAYAVGVFVFKMNPSVLLGGVAGARENTAAMRVAQEESQGSAPAIGFPVPLAVSTLVLTIAGYVCMLIP